MADSPWIAEIETGRWYVWGPGPNGETIRRYSDELDTTTSYQPNNDQLYGQYPSPSSAGQVYERVLSSNSSSILIGRQYPEVPRGPSSRADQPHYSGQGQHGVVTGSSSRPERQQRYLDSGGYNPETEPGRRLASCQTETPSIRAPIEYPEPATYDPNSLSTGMSRLSVNELGSSSANFRLSYSPPQPRWTATPSGRGRGSYQGRGKAPAARQPSRSRPIRATPGEAEDLDPKYRMRNTDWKTFFECGRVFKTLWTDPAGPEDASEADQFMSKARYKVAHGQYVYSKIRRFVVVSRHDRSCQCLPVTTYDGKGYRKRNIKLEEHGLIYTGNRRPGPIQGISMEPLLIKNAAEQLDLSYINYGRSYCVDTNVKVKDVGVLDSTSRRLLRKYYEKVHFPADDDSRPRSIDDPVLEDDFRGMGSGFQEPSSSSDYPLPGSQYDDELYSEDPASLTRPLSGPLEPPFEDTQYRTSSPPVQEETYSTASSSCPTIVQIRRDSEIDLEKDFQPTRRRDSNAGGGRRRK